MLLLLLAAIGCLDLGMPRLRSEPPLVEVTDVRERPVDAHRPTDLLLLPDGAVLVLDGYAGRAIELDRDGAVVRAHGGPGAWGRPVRMAAARDGGSWLSVPDTGLLLLVDEGGSVVRSLASGFAPVAVLDLGEELVVSDRAAGLRWLEPSTGAVRRSVEHDAEGEPLGTITDLARLPDGGLLAVDALGSRIHRFDVHGNPTSSFGRFGLWIGSMNKPKGVAPFLAGTALVADSALGAVQLFDADGAPLGVLAVDDAPLSFDHPIAVEVRDDLVYVLESGAARVRTLRLADGELERARSLAATRFLRVPLGQGDDPAIDADVCAQCHDGLVNDGREVWDPKLHTHSQGVALAWELPAFFPVDDDGRMTCTTCHSPHGTSTLDEALGVGTSEERAPLLRHGDSGELFTRLTRGDSALCAACHEDAAHEASLGRKELGGGAHPTGRALREAMAGRRGGAEADEGCLGCHAVHAAEPGGLTRATVDGLACAGCHDPQATPGRTHPLDERPGEVAAAAHLPVATSGEQTCRSCHDLVGGRDEALLRAPKDGGALCVVCHDEQEVGEGATHGEVPGDPSCLGCHDVHGAPLEDHLLGTLEGASAGDPSGCGSCHGPDGAAATAGVRPGVVGHPVDGERHGRDTALTCESCHDPHRAEERVACGTCHEVADAHARGGHRDTPCVACHPVHSEPERVAPAGTAPQNAVCMSCHGPGREAARADVRPGQVGHPVDGAASLNRAPLACASCHDAHTPDPEVACGSCHAEEATEHHQGGHVTVACVDCHPVHAPPPPLGGEEGMNPQTRRCLACHGEGGGATRVARFEHAAPVFRSEDQRWAPVRSLPLFAADGSAVLPAANGALTCASCHQTHGHAAPTAGGLPPPDWKGACASCHGGEALLLYLHFHQPERVLGGGSGP